MEIHRCRFVPYQPAGINAVAFSHPTPRSGIHSFIARLAVGRSNGDVEIWNPLSGAWYQELVIRGGRDRSIDSLVWINEPDQDMGGGRVRVGKSRLFSIGYTSTVTEWDLEKREVKRHASGQHGDIWCLAAQPAPASASDPDGQKLLVGTVDGDLAIYSVDDDDLCFRRIVVKSPAKKAQMVSMTFQSRKVCIVGCSDSTIRAYDLRNGHMLQRMTLGSDLKGGTKNIIVWCVKCLPNGDIVSGDSTGQICIWNGQTYTQSQRIEGHKQDVLSLAIGAEGTSIISGGMDQRTFLYRPNGGPAKRWTKVWGRRFHDHDVKTMASFEHGKMSVLVSGGPDADLIVIPLKEMGRQNHRALSCLPQQPPIASASHCRFIVSWWDRQVHIWILRKTASELLGSTGEAVDIKQNQKLLKSIIVRGDSNITSIAMDENGHFLFVATATDVKAFYLEHDNPAKPSDVTVTSLKLPRSMTRLGASQVKLSPDGEWLCLVQQGQRVLMVGLPRENASKGSSDISVRLHRLSRLHRDIPQYIAESASGKYSRNITHIAFSADSRMLAVADLAGYVDTWILGGGEAGVDDDDAASSSSSDSGDESLEKEGGDARWRRNPAAELLPKLPSAAVVLSFSSHVPARVCEAGDDADSTDDYVLAAVTSLWHVLTFHPRQGSLTPWCRRHPRSVLPGKIRDIRDLPKGILWRGSRMWVYGVSFLLMLDLSQDLKVVDDSRLAQGKKRKRAGPRSGAGSINEAESLTPHKIRKYGRGGQHVEVMTGRGSQDDESDSDDELPDADVQMARPRQAGSGSGREKWWLTFKYRPMLGIVPLSETDDQTLEVALVERPAWDKDMPVRYYAEHELER
ncbi:hypothetical protein L249_7797 [Ophiocordyceps polyrhachis-furcata BCC 54312]|uniref:Uncharacterized protein n=1 Tax=Ophiocordyceps polyrhachis-furcata BCC 54312 TaxID=1330021 RepID=A0A367L0R4_9HYPO|nr:hypothetical protein L249_7797 [Ophiocordyceps polyrhachis-furcata BCC 54312]